MHLIPRWADRNLSRLELVVAWIIILLLIGTFTRYMLIVFAQAERSMVERTVLNIETALKYKAGLARMKSEHSVIGQLADSNPILQLQSTAPAEATDEGMKELQHYMPVVSSFATPGNYGGEIASVNPDTVEQGHWYYNTMDESLVYIIQNHEFFTSDLNGIPRLRYRVNIDYIDRNGNAEFDPGTDVFRSIDLDSMDAFEWLF